MFSYFNSNTDYKEKRKTMIYTNEIIKEINLKKEKRKKIRKIILLPILLLIIFFVVDVFFQKFIQKKSNIQFLGMKPFIVMTGSMEPNLKIGDMVIIKKISSQNEIQVGDIITYSLENGKDTVTHRVINIVKEDGNIFYQTKGDNNNSPDSNLVSFDKILGKKIYQIGEVGEKISYIFSETGIMIICLIILLHYTISNGKRMRIIAREEARRIYNIPKYNKKEESV